MMIRFEGQALHLLQYFIIVVCLSYNIVLLIQTRLNSELSVARYSQM